MLQGILVSCHLFCFEGVSDFALTTLIKRKSEVGQAIVNAVAFYENQYKEKGYGVRRIRFDNGGEYAFALVADFCAQKGIIQDFSSRETPQQNGKDKRFG